MSNKCKLIISYFDLEIMMIYLKNPCKNDNIVTSIIPLGRLKSQTGKFGDNVPNSGGGQ